MITLFHLLRKIPFLPDEEIARELGISADSVRVYKWRLKRNFVTGVTKFSDYCPECFQKSVILDKETGERVCTNCGFVVEEDPESKISTDIPFGTDEKPNTYALTSHIAYGKSLGFTASRNHLFRVLARVSMRNHDSAGRIEDGEFQIPIRQIQTITETVDPPIVRAMLNYGSRLLKELGLDEDKDRNHILADRYGRLLRKIAAYLTISKSNLQPHQAARAALFYILRTVDPEKAKKAQKDYPFDRKYLNLVSTIYTQL
jgi:hypothetical protein